VKRARVFKWQVVAGGALLALIGFTFAGIWLSGRGEQREVRLPDGALLLLTRAKFGATNEFPHGRPWENLLGKLIPAKGLQIARLKLERPAQQAFKRAGKPWLVTEFQLVPADTNANHALMNPAFYRQFRCLVSGGTGLEYVEEFWGNNFKKQRDGYFAYIVSSRFPRDSKWLDFRIQQQATRNGPWQEFAKFKIRNPTRPANHAWVAAQVGGMEFTLQEISVEQRAVVPRDIWNHQVLLPFRVQTNGVTLTNWSAARIEAEDASGNWEFVGTLPASTNDWIVHRAWRSLDPRFVWKVDVDFAPQSDFAPGGLCTLQVPVRLAQPIKTNFAGLSFEIKWVNGSMLAVEMTEKRPDLRLVFAGARNSSGKDLYDGAGSWSQHEFWKSLNLDGAESSIDATFAIVPNVHVTYFVQPRTVFSPQ